MIGDYATKPLQGALFRKFRDQIMGVVPAQDPGPGKTDRNVGKSETAKNEPKSRQAKSLVPPGKGRHHRRSVLGKVDCAKDAQKRTKDLRVTKMLRDSPRLHVSVDPQEFNSLLLNNLVDNGSI
jgi:hypothetical protein